MYEHIGSIGSFLLGAGVLINAVMSVFTWIATYKTTKNMKELALNTNSIKDALIKVTGEEALARGTAEGRAAAIAETNEIRKKEINVNC